MGLTLKSNKKTTKRILIGLIIFELLLVLLFSINLSIGRPKVTDYLFNLNNESTIPMWFSSMQLFVIGLLLILKTFDHNQESNVSPRFLQFTGIVAIFLSMDEAIELHENIGDVIQQFSWIPKFNHGFGSWISAYIFIGIIIIGITWKQITILRNSSPEFFRTILFGASLFAFGAVGLEIFAYQYLWSENPSQLYYLEIAIEEFLEMSGASIILYGTMNYVFCNKEEIKK